MLSQLSTGLSGPVRQKGYLLMEALIALAVVGTITLMMTRMFNEQRENQEIQRQTQWMAQYLNGIAGYMAQQGPIEPAILTRNGTDWLKSVECGGSFPDEDAFLSCAVPTDFNESYGLGAPEVTFDYTMSPRASINFGIVIIKPSGEPNPRLASKLSAAMREHVRSAGYQHVEVFHSLPDNSDIADASLRAVVDSQFAADIHLRIDGMNEMKGPILTEHDGWALIARAEDGSENRSPQNSAGSINVNDAFVRASGDDGYWASETHAIAEEALRLAAQSVQGATEVESTGRVDAPTCPSGYTPQIFVSQVALLGGTQANPNLIAGYRRLVTKHPAAATGNNIQYWTVTIQATEEETIGWKNVDPGNARALALTRCSPV